MTLEQTLLLSFIQGVTEFLPVSSSGHLALMSSLCGWPYQGAIIDAAAHLGTLGSVLLYFWRDVLSLMKAPFTLLRGKTDESTRLFCNLIIATLPIVLAGLVFDHFVGDSLKTMTVFAWMSLLFGLLLYVADREKEMTQTLETITGSRALCFGLAQCLALVNGVSRSGICITLGRFMGYKRTEAVRFAFLMSIPTILAAGTVKGYQLCQQGDLSLLNDAVLVAAFSFLFGLGTITFLMRWIQAHSLTPFALYRVFLGLILLLGILH